MIYARILEWLSNVSVGSIIAVCTAVSVVCVGVWKIVSKILELYEKYSGKPKPRKGQDDQETVDRFGRANHKGFQAQILLLLLEHDLDFPTMRIVLQHLLIGKA